MTDVAIDTCIFEHYLNLSSTWNADHHIDRLLSALQRRRVRLCVDSNNRISGEYNSKIAPIIRGCDESGIERFVLSYWMLHCPRKEITTDERDARMTIIKRIIHEQEPVDRAFVYVACAGDCKLVTNDSQHILGRRRELRGATKRFRGRETDFISSRQAEADILEPQATP